ncbi:type IX secretion system ring subunit PorN/GldN [Mucilaginibacter paludis]|uniref:Gliding motility associated protein GldN n=1 Tax=Mucilaginibacter paludis DSM 18603 TaxID=714943 RepID=H1Y4N5_9SPHI|nr:gliding motility protein GldN [Mucilaginibacter paludis]EHQ28079.1 gliding motility associated protein GldN [Mucilaginibacter paludis DSM 18603]
MKKGLLLILFLSVISVTYAQKKKARTRSKKATTTAAVNNNAPNSNTTIAVTQTALVDTNKKPVVAPVLDRPLDGYYKKTNTLSAQPVAYATLRQADVIFAKRIWREIDLREKMNQYMASPKARLIDVLVDAIQADELRAFDASPSKGFPNGDEFAIPLTSKQAMAKLADSVLVDKLDKDGNKISSEMRMGEFNPDSIVKFRIKEDWIFDKERSVFEPRIIGIAPLIQIKIGAETLDYQPAFWIYFPEARPILAAKEVSMRNNDATNLSYDQVFLKRIFSSYITKESNEKDERIKDYAQGIDKLYESERIKKSLMDWELNLWQY